MKNFGDRRSSISSLHPSGIRDNRSRGTAFSFIADTVQPASRLSIVSAYFTSAAFGALSSTLEGIHSARFLFGEPRFLSQVDAESLDPPAFSLTEGGLALTEQLRQSAIASQCAAWIRGRVSVRSIRQAGLLHGKLIHVHDGAREHAMVGSSNFTLKGLGFTEAPNIELNLVVDGDRDRADLLRWFDETWADDGLTVDVKGEVLRRLERLYRHNSPEFIYHKTLFHLFENFLADQMVEDDRFGSPAFTDSAVWQMLYSFQRDGARAVLGKLDRHGGCILADSVGLGKTLTAISVIKWYELRNQRVLVLCPKKLRENWTQYLAANNSDLNPLRQDRLAYTVLSHSDLTRESGSAGDIDLARFNWAGFDLVVIDESHAFRNASGARYRRLLNEVLQGGNSTRVLLLSATPVNNDLADLQAQLELIAQGRPGAFSAMGAPNLAAIIGESRRAFAEWMRSGGRDVSALLLKLPAALTSLLDGVSIARSRHHIERHYADALDDANRFPSRAKPISLYPGIDLADSFPRFDEVDREIDALNLALYNPFAYVLPDYRPRYDERDGRTKGFNQADREKYLVAMMKVGFLKRLESSVFSFSRTMTRIVSRIDDRLAAIGAFRIAATASAEAQIPGLNDEADDDEDLAAAFEVGGQLKYALQHININSWEAALRRDRELILSLAKAATDVGPGRDAKLSELKRLIADKARCPTVNRDGTRNRKLILFTAFSDTARYLYGNLEPFARELDLHIGLVTGSGCASSLGRARFQDVLANFSPRSKKRATMRATPEPEIDLLIATDCISEGQNLQDADTVVNVDIHWNPVRLIQRFGRIDRIGAQAECVQMINLWPTDDLNRYLNLRERVEARMALVDLSATGDDNLLADSRQAAEGASHWRDEQLRRLRTEVFELEGSGGVGLTDFTFDEFRADLIAYARSKADELRGAPLGLHALAPRVVNGSAYDAGVILCLRRNGASTDSSVNPLEPYYLAYVSDSGPVRQGFAQPKAVLEALAALCVGRSQPFEKLCDAFDAETRRGSDLVRYDALISAALADIGRGYAARAVAGLAMGRGGKLADEHSQARYGSDYELVTWLIVPPSDESTDDRLP